jgi:hypothetical protein
MVGGADGFFDGTLVGFTVGFREGVLLGSVDGMTVGLIDRLGLDVGFLLPLGSVEGIFEGLTLGALETEGVSDGFVEGSTEGNSDGAMLGMLEGFIDRFLLGDDEGLLDGLALGRETFIATFLTQTTVQLLSKDEFINSPSSHSSPRSSCPFPHNDSPLVVTLISAMLSTNNWPFSVGISLTVYCCPGIRLRRERIGDVR